MFKYNQEKFASMATKMQEMAETQRATNLKLHRDLKPNQYNPQREILPNTPDSMNSKYPRRSSGSSSNNGYIPLSSERQSLLPHPRAREFSPPLRESSRNMDDGYGQPKRQRRTSPNQGQCQIESFDEYYEQQQRMDDRRK